MISKPEIITTISAAGPPIAKQKKLQHLARLGEDVRLPTIHCTVLYCTASVPKQEEASTGKCKHEVEAETECWYFLVIPDLSQDKDIIQFLKSMYSTVYALGFVPASTIPRDGTGW